MIGECFGAPQNGGRAMKFMCPYCQVEYTVEAPCFCQPAATAVVAQPVSQVEVEPRLAPEDALAVILALRVPARAGGIAQA